MVDGTVSDLYDFDYFAEEADAGAIIQAGYGTLSSSNGAGGKVFETEVNMQGNAVPDQIDIVQIIM